MPKKWIILLTIVLVIVIVAALLASYKPPEVTMTIKSMKWVGDGKLNLTLTFTTKESNLTSEYKVRVVARRTVEETETKQEVLNQQLEPVPAESTDDQVFTISGLSGYTDLNIQIFKGSKQIIFRTTRLPIA